MKSHVIYRDLRRGDLLVHTYKEPHGGELRRGDSFLVLETGPSPDVPGLMRITYVVPRTGRTCHENVNPLRELYPVGEWTHVGGER